MPSFRILLLWGLLLLNAPVAMAQKSQKFALLIGNQAYDASVGVLRNPHNDIDMVAKALATQGFEILPLVKDARRSTIHGAVRDFASRLRNGGPGSVGFLFYSGHGVAEKDTGINYVIPIDARDPGSAGFWDDSLKLDDIIGLLDNAPSAAKFIVLDASRNELKLPERTPNMGLLPVREHQGVFTASSTAAGRTVSDSSTTNGAYAVALAAELEKPGQDHLNLFQNVKESVLAATGGAQLPWESNGLTRRVYLTGQPTAPTELELWESVRATNDAIALEQYLVRFPSGVFAGTAKQMIERLKAEEASRRLAEASETKREAEKGALPIAAEAQAKRRAEEDRPAAAKPRPAATACGSASTHSYKYWPNGTISAGSVVSIVVPSCGRLTCFVGPWAAGRSRECRWGEADAATARADNDPCRAAPRPKRGALPDLCPWPPPKASAWDVVPNDLVTGKASAPAQVANVITRFNDALDSAGYHQRSYFKVPGGVAIVTQLERIDEDGSPLGRNRWAASSTSGMSALLSYLKGLVLPVEGHYRLLIIVMTDTPFMTSSTTLEANEAKDLVNRGMHAIPERAAKEEYSYAHSTTVLVYQFRQIGKGKSEFVQPSTLTGRQHLLKSRVLAALQSSSQR